MEAWEAESPAPGLELPLLGLEGEESGSWILELFPGILRVPEYCYWPPGRRHCHYFQMTPDSSIPVVLPSSCSDES